MSKIMFEMFFEKLMNLVKNFGLRPSKDLARQKAELPFWASSMN